MKLPQIPLSNGSIELLKWLGLVLMTGDHINKYLYSNAVPGLFKAGRLAMPIFLFVLSYKMAHSDTAACARTVKRIALFGIFAVPGYIALGHKHLLAGWMPLNIMFTLLVLVLAISLLKQGRRYTATSFVVFGGALVEFWWPAIILGLAVYYYCQQPSWKAAFWGMIGYLLLCLINGNFWALAALPLFFIVPQINLRIPRLKWVFYSYYPLHLVLIWLIHIYMVQPQLGI